MNEGYDSINSSGDNRNDHNGDEDDVNGCWP